MTLSTEKHVSALLDRMQASGLKLKLKKCIFAASKVSCPGSIVFEHAVNPNPEKLSALKDMPAPVNAKGSRDSWGGQTVTHTSLPDFVEQNASLLQVSLCNGAACFAKSGLKCA